MSCEATKAPSPSTAETLKSLQKRITALCIRIATARANYREKLPLNHTTWTREDAVSTDLNQLQIDLEDEWINIQGESLELKMVWVDFVEAVYADLSTFYEGGC
ncbi:hypothetical protein COCC4DRAFT_126687 [Bipolaris maydis ATCC 48331]|uniref:Uncharacterized protein n=2 Tax=Cochliobolus heterostrophus TaxID=5016 RepID=M2SYU2_COCH5|nr:uncharacterized protein COCC4DRAFT_126687 [Bipolaris maydis ATCC 48331]EMD90555.1 hypothetical protein COCHEDRAFT_1215528 [Bipolaris maydis C5]ENI09233.1 hypothetical protein COCC4DRAFT_126687 [Bipolaris maydis ATCC 48331]